MMFENTRPDDAGTCQIKDKHSHDTLVREVRGKLPPDEIEVGEIIIIKPFERIPLDGIITEGTSSVNTSALTGEALPSDKTVGDSVISGTVNLSSVIKVEVKRAYSESTVSKILDLVQNASEKKTKSENF